MPRSRRWRAVMVWSVVLAAMGCSSMIPGEPLDPPVLSLRGIEPEALGINAQVFRARLGLFNPNSVPLKVSGGEVNLRVENTAAAQGRTVASFEVPPGGQVEVEILLTINALRDGPALLQALSSRTRSGVSYELNGYVYVQRRGADRVDIRANGIIGDAMSLPDADEPGTPPEMP